MDRPKTREFAFLMFDFAAAVLVFLAWAFLGPGAAWAAAGLWLAFVLAVVQRRRAARRTPAAAA